MRQFLDTISYHADTLIATGFLLLLAVAVSIGLYALCANHNIERYVIDGAEHNLVCVVAQKSWTNNTTVYCSQSPQDAVDFARKANEVIHTK